MGGVGFLHRCQKKTTVGALIHYALPDSRVARSGRNELRPLHARKSEMMFSMAEWQSRKASFN